MTSSKIDSTIARCDRCGYERCAKCGHEEVRVNIVNSGPYGMLILVYRVWLAILTIVLVF